jgi:hypothetical protein
MIKDGISCSQKWSEFSYVSRTETNVRNDFYFSSSDVNIS